MLTPLFFIALQFRFLAIRWPLILQFKVVFHCDRVKSNASFAYFCRCCFWYCLCFLKHFFSLQNAIEIPAFYHRQWEPDYPEFIEFKYEGANYEIRVRKHKGKLFFADGLTRLRIELQIYESITINFLACDHHSKFDLHFTPPLHQQTCKRLRRASRKHIWTIPITQSMLGESYPLVKYSYLFISSIQMLISMLNFFFL